MPETNRRHFLAASAATALLSLTGCGPKRSATGKYSLPASDVSGGNALKSHAAKAGMLFGFALDVRRVRSDAAYRTLVEQQCSIVVAENAMKWHGLRPAVDRYFFDDADLLVQFASERRIRMRGHNLCWHEALPDWFASQVTRENARQVLRDHIRTVAGRYAGRMHSWDVVNEAINVKDGRPDGLRNSPWLQLVGTDYIETAFRVARDADPTALLTYNDYGMESETSDAAQKRAAILLLLRRLKQRNVPIDAMGIQSHIQGGPQTSYGAGLQQFIRSCSDMGLEVFITEMDVNDRDLPPQIDTRDAAVAERYRSYLNLVLPSKSVTALLTWGASDAGTWLNSGDRARKDGTQQRPLLFDDHLRPKQAFAAVRAALDARRGTHPLSAAGQKQAPRLPKL